MVGVLVPCVRSLFRCAVLIVIFSFTRISLNKRELVASQMSFWCHVVVIVLCQITHGAFCWYAMCNWAISGDTHLSEITLTSSFFGRIQNTDYKF